MGHYGNRVKRVVYIITKAERGGAQMHLLELLRGLREDMELHLGIGEEGGNFLIQEAKKLEVNIHVLRHLKQSINIASDILALKEIITLIRHVRPDIVHAHSSKAGMIGRVAARALSVKSIFTAHGWAFTEGVPPGRRRLALAAEKLAGRLGDRVIAVSQYDHDLALRNHVVPEEKLRLVWNGVPDSLNRSSPELEPPKIVMVARFAKPKDQALLLRALTDMQKIPWTIEFVGEGPSLNQVKELAMELHIWDRVRFLGARRDIPELLASSQIFVLASNWEGLPLSILEAMRAGLPVVATDVGGVREAVMHEVTGFLVRKGSEEDMREKIMRLILDSSLRVKMGASGRKRYEDKFKIDDMLAGVKKVYRELL